MFWSNISTKAIQNIIFSESSLHAYRREKEGISGQKSRVGSEKEAKKVVSLHPGKNMK